MSVATGPGATTLTAMIASPKVLISLFIIGTNNPQTIAAHIAQGYKESTPDRLSVLIATGLVASLLILVFMSSMLGVVLADNVLVLFVALVAGGLSFVANKAAFHQGAILSASGDRVATALVVAWFGDDLRCGACAIQ